MSAPIPSEQPRGALAYAPKWARQQAAEADFGCGVPEGPAEDTVPPLPIVDNAIGKIATPDAARHDSSPKGETAKNATPRGAKAKGTAAKGATSNKPWWRGRPPIFEGDSAIVELRQRLKLAPDQIPEPRPPRAPSGSFVAIFRLTIVAVAAAGAWGGYSFWVARDQTAEPQLETVSHERLPTGSAQAASVLPATADPAELAAVPQAPAPTLRAIEPLPWPGAQGNDAAMRDVAAGSGIATRAALPPLTETKVGAAVDASPHDVIEVGRANTARAEPVAVAPANEPPAIQNPPAAAAAPSRAIIPPPAPVPQAPAMETKEAEALLARAQTFLTNGDVAAARLVLRRAAEAGVARAALALGDTYDPQVLKQLGVVGILGDLNEARGWYRRAAELGSTDAPQRLLAENRGSATDSR